MALRLLVAAAALAGAQAYYRFNNTEATDGAKLGGLMQKVLANHNFHRCLHGAAPLRWSQSIAAGAQRHAVSKRAMSFDMTWPGGELFTGNQGYPYASQKTRPEFGFALGDLEYRLYKQHMEQVVWKSATKLGCGVFWGKYRNPGGQLVSSLPAYMLVCRYDQPVVASLTAENVGKTDASASRVDACAARYKPTSLPLSQVTGGALAQARVRNVARRSPVATDEPALHGNLHKTLWSKDGEVDEDDEDLEASLLSEASGEVPADSAAGADAGLASRVTRTEVGAGGEHLEQAKACPRGGATALDG